MSYQFNDNIITHVPTCCLVEDYQGLAAAVHNMDWEAVQTVIDCLGETIDRFTEVPVGLNIKPSGSSAVAMDIENGIILDGYGKDLLCAAGKPVSFAMAGGVCQCPDDCGVRIDFGCDPEGCRVCLACGARTDDGEGMIQALETSEDSEPCTTVTEYHPDTESGVPLTKEEQVEFVALLKKRCKNLMRDGQCHADSCENCHIQAILTQLETDRLAQYARCIVKLSRDLDMFEFMDRVEDLDEFAAEVREYLSSGNLTPIRIWLEGIEDDDNGNAVRLSALLDAFEKGEPFADG